MKTGLDPFCRRSVSSVQLVAQIADEYGYDVDAALAESGISRESLRQGKARIEARQELWLIENLVRQGLPEELAFSLGTRYRTSVLGFFGYGLMTSATVRDAIVFAQQYAPLAFTFSPFTFEESEQVFRFQVDSAHLPRDARCFIVIRDAVATAMLFRDFAGFFPPLRALRVPLRHSPLREQLFLDLFNLTPEFDAPGIEAELDSDLLCRTLPLSNAVTHEECRELCEQQLEESQRRTTLAGQVRAFLHEYPGHLASAERLAEAFHTSARTLRRKLSAEGVTYRALVEEIRKDLATRWLLDSAYNSSRIAEMLGYRETSSFITAFKRWTGLTPEAFRRHSRRRDASEEELRRA